MEKIAFYIRENPLLFKNVCEIYKYLYLDSDPEIKYVILKKILNDIERIQEQTNNTINWNFFSNIQTGNNFNNSGNNIEDLNSNKQEIYKYGFKDIAEKYCSNIQKSNIPSINISNNNLNSFTNNNVNIGSTIIGGNNNGFVTPRGNYSLIHLLLNEFKLIF